MADPQGLLPLGAKNDDVMCVTFDLELEVFITNVLVSILTFIQRSHSVIVGSFRYVTYYSLLG